MGAAVGSVLGEPPPPLVVGTDPLLVGEETGAPLVSELSVAPTPDDGEGDVLVLSPLLRPSTCWPGPPPENVPLCTCVLPEGSACSEASGVTW